MENQIHSLDFFTGGKAIFTVSSPERHYTFKIQKPKNTGNRVFRKDMYFVYLLTGPDNTSSYTYIGMYIPGNLSNPLILTAKSRVEEGSKPVRAFNWAVRLISSKKTAPEGYTIQHEGCCCRCGRTLTTPESIERGIGPECWERYRATLPPIEPSPLNSIQAETKTV